MHAVILHLARECWEFKDDSFPVRMAFLCAGMHGSAKSKAAIMTD